MNMPDIVTPEDFRNKLIGRTIKSINTSDCLESDLSYRMLWIEFDDGTSISFQADHDHDIYALWSKE